MLEKSGALFVFAMPICAQEHPPQILEIYRDFPKAGGEAAYRRIEEDAARICGELRCPHPYVGIESLTGPKEAWWLNGYESPARTRQEAEAKAAAAGEETRVFAVRPYWSMPANEWAAADPAVWQPARAAKTE